MIAKANRRFWECFYRLPPAIRRIAIAKFRLWKSEPFHPSLRFKEIANGIWSARISRDYRALARRKGDLVVWFWVGTHKDYDHLIGKK